MEEFKKELIDLLEKSINTDELKSNHGCAVEFIAEGMIDSIATSLRLASIAKEIPKDFKL
ncbi:hypothetical protein NVP1276O_64 [Vibrio phage 1.276.O._10N.286.54.E4]|nr:hypothetical protein NVP1276O_64 [Vibrio phage 1.276.O._10N.286.54.E4]